MNNFIYLKMNIKRFYLHNYIIIKKVMLNSKLNKQNNLKRKGFPNMMIYFLYFGNFTFTIMNFQYSFSIYPILYIASYYFNYCLNYIIIYSSLLIKLYLFLNKTYKKNSTDLVYQIETMSKSIQKNKMIKRVQKLKKLINLPMDWQKKSLNNTNLKELANKSI